MSDFSVQRRISKTRKPHICEFCRLQIDEGESATKYVSADHISGFCSFYLCDTCVTLWQECNLDWSEGMTDFQDELCNWFYGIECPSCGEIGTWDWEFNRKTQMVVFKCDQCEHEWEVNLFKYLEIDEWRAK